MHSRKTISFIGAAIGWLVLGVAALGLLGLGAIGFWGSVTDIEPVWRFVPVEAQGTLISSYSSIERCNAVGSWNSGYGGECYRRYATVYYTYAYSDRSFDGSFETTFRFRGGDQDVPVGFKDVYGEGKTFTVYVDPEEPSVTAQTRSIDPFRDVAVPILSLGWIALVVYGAYRVITDPIGGNKKQR